MKVRTSYCIATFVEYYLFYSGLWYDVLLKAPFSKISSLPINSVPLNLEEKTSKEIHDNESIVLFRTIGIHRCRCIRP